MPITIKSSRMQYRKSNGDYVGVDAVSERKTSEYVSEIESTGSATQSAIEQTASTAQSAIDTKAQQARDSIPSDYTALSDEVSDLKSTLSDNNEAVSASDWQKLYLSKSSDNSVTTIASDTRICTTKKLKLSTNQMIQVKAQGGYKYRVIFFSAIGNGNIASGMSYGVSQGEYNDLTDWHTEPNRLLKCPSGAVAFTINVEKDDGSAISVDDGTNISILVSFSTNILYDTYILGKATNEQLEDYNASLQLQDLNTALYEAGGVTIRYISDGIYNVSGRATFPISRTIAGGNNVVPKGFAQGKTFFVKGTGDNVVLSITEYINGAEQTAKMFYEDGDYTVSENCSGIAFKLNVAQGTIVDEDIKPEVLNAYTNEKLTEYVREKTANDSNVINMRAQYSGTVNGVTYNFVGDLCEISGTATALSYVRILGSSTTMPSALTPGSYVKIKFSGINVSLHFIQYNAKGNVISSKFFYSDDIESISEDAAAIEVRLRVATGVTVNETVAPYIINHISDIELSKTCCETRIAVDQRNPIVQCAKSYYAMTRANRYTYGKRSALYYHESDPIYDPEVDIAIDQVHCGGLTVLIASGCPFGSSRYANPNVPNASFEAGYGFDFEAYSLKLAQAGNQAEISYIGADNVYKTVAELKKLMLFKTSYGLSTACNRWGFIVQKGQTIDTSLLRIGDIVFYGNPNSGEEQWIDGKLIVPELIDGNLMTHCDTVISFDNGKPYVIDAGAAPITIHEYNPGQSFAYVCIGRVPLFDILI